LFSSPCSGAGWQVNPSHPPQFDPGSHDLVHCVSQALVMHVPKHTTPSPQQSQLATSLPPLPPGGMQQRVWVFGSRKPQLPSAPLVLAMVRQDRELPPWKQH